MVTDFIGVQNFLTSVPAQRSNYIAAWYAAKMMVPAKQGLIVNLSSSGGLKYLFNVAYGTGKAAVSNQHKLRNIIIS